MREKKEQEEHTMKRIKIFDTTLRDGEQSPGSGSDSAARAGRKA